MIKRNKNFKNSLLSISSHLKKQKKGNNLQKK